MATNALPCDVARIAGFHFSSLGTPFALKQLKMLQDSDWMGLAKSSVDPRSYTSAHAYALDASAAGLLKKFKGLPIAEDVRRKAATEKWLEGERQCAKTNERLTCYLPEFANANDRVEGVSAFIRTVRKIILKWIGPRPPDFLEGRFGPGATFSDRGRRTTVPDKMMSDPVLTYSALMYLPQWLGTQWGLFQAQRGKMVTFCPGNRFATAPKTSLTHRSIASEPPINVFFQLALGRILKSRLRRFAHWDLNRAAELHRLVAQASSLSKEFATLDLSNASDTLAKVLVKLLLPQAWYEALYALRSAKTLKDGKWVYLEKFSSMGNGFTFELETLIFAALSVAVTRQCGGNGWLGRDVYVFGDDIIVKDDVVRPLKAVLEFFGFTLNTEKSFWGGVPFRESCGGDFFDGKPVRPYHLKEELDEPHRYIALANGLRLSYERIAETGNAPSLRAWFATLDFLPHEVRKCRGPKALGDLVIYDEQSKWTYHWKDGIRYFKAWVPLRHEIVSWKHFHPDVVLACATYGTGGGVARGVRPRDSVLSYGVDWIPYS